ncbi:MAG TPA: hypothetical protein P5275_03210 [Saprospiraceae bacterium]|nr:hypothetical protein [Saprospiraceae bacterium]HPG05385.1 hypothetical protein [Saprospiraceae bacterium]HRV83837.1 hypothetical protein [Saprospiraceae bacterium]
MKPIRIVILLLSVLPFTLVAHPGHGVGNGWTLSHYAGSMEHSWILVVAIVAFSYWLVRNTKKSSS